MPVPRRQPIGIYACILLALGLLLKLKRYAMAKEAVGNMDFNNIETKSHLEAEVTQVVEGLTAANYWDWAGNVCLLIALVLLLVRQSWIMAARREGRARKALEVAQERNRRRHQHRRR